uniref:Purine-nucleoside phosphorylase n=1 Tax=Panagrolaimus sp. PS1159 TaxID=55785 RepID=A0AC35FEM3_9BILA
MYNRKSTKSVLNQLKLAEKPKIGIICGSGLGTIGNVIKNAQILPFEKIEGFSQTTLKGHRGNLLFGYIGDKYVLCMQGRIHPYEHNMNTSFCASPIR